MCSVFSHAWLFVTPGTVAHQAPLSMGSSKQEYWSGLPFSSPGDLPDAGNKPVSPALAGGFFTSEPPEKSLSLSLFLYIYMCVCVFQFSSITQSCPTLYNPMDCDTPGFPVQLQHPELAQTHVHQVGDAIQPFHPLLSPSPPPFTSGDQSIGASALASALPMHVQHWFPLGLTSLISLQSKGLFSSTTPQKHQLFSAQLSLWSNSHIHTWLLEKP